MTNRSFRGSPEVGSQMFEVEEGECNTNTQTKHKHTNTQTHKHTNTQTHKHTKHKTQNTKHKTQKQMQVQQIQLDFVKAKEMPRPRRVKKLARTGTNNNSCYQTTRDEDEEMPQGQLRNKKGLLSHRFITRSRDLREPKTAAKKALLGGLRGGRGRATK